MEYFILEHNPLYKYNPQIINIQSHIDIIAFKNDETVDIKPRILLEYIGDEYTVFPDFLLDRMPFISKKIKNIINVFYKNLVYKEVILKENKSSDNHMYYLAKLKNFSDIVIETENRKPRVINASIVKNEDVFYIQNNNELYLCANLIVVENIFRNGGNGFILEKLYLE